MLRNKFCRGWGLHRDQGFLLPGRPSHKNVSSFKREVVVGMLKLLRGPGQKAVNRRNQEKRGKGKSSSKYKNTKKKTTTYRKKIEVLIMLAPVPRKKVKRGQKLRKKRGFGRESSGTKCKGLV